MSADVNSTSTRRDTSGVLTDALAGLLAGGEQLRALATTIALPADIATFRAEHRAWVFGCLPVLSRGFEPESVGEFLHVNSRFPQRVEPTIAQAAAVAVLRDALELLRGLRMTLELNPRA
jgi:hypothetical protein